MMETVRTAEWLSEVTKQRSGHPGFLRPGVEARQIFAVTSNGSEERDLWFSTSDTSDKLLSFYRGELKNRGMKVGANTATESGEKISATGDSGKHSVDVAVTPVPGGQTIVIVTYTSRP